LQFLDEMHHPAPEKKRPTGLNGRRCARSVWRAQLT
jgi:hypothetical protein